MIISKLDAARVQLDRAIECFFNDDHICAVTLGGAAEDLLAGLLIAPGEQDPFHFLHDWYQQTYKTTIKEKDFSRQVANLARNWLKHAELDPQSKYDITPENSLSMLMRAVPCYKKLTGEHTYQMDRFFHYVQTNIHQFDQKS